ncbi:MAG: hypothetical protein ACJ762_17055 [Solirubrobacteraceae bacterium]
MNACAWFDRNRGARSTQPLHCALGGGAPRVIDLFTPSESSLAVTTACGLFVYVQRSGAVATVTLKWNGHYGMSSPYLRGLANRVTTRANRTSTLPNVVWRYGRSS